MARVEVVEEFSESQGDRHGESQGDRHGVRSSMYKETEIFTSLFPFFFVPNDFCDGN